MIVMMIFFFFYSGTEASVSIYLVPFSVKSDLKLSKEIGSQIMRTFWGCFAAIRFTSIFTAIFVKPVYVLTASCLLSSIGSVLLAVFGNESTVMLWLGSAIIGLGLSSTYASGFLWLKSYLKITNQIGMAKFVCNGIIS